MGRLEQFKYTGTDWNGDMEAVARDPETQRWWKVTDEMQETLVKDARGSGQKGGWWLDLQEVFRFEGDA